MNDNQSGLFALNIIAENQTGVMKDISALMAEYEANIVMIQQSIINSGEYAGLASAYFEFQGCRDSGALVSSLLALPSIREVSSHEPLWSIFGTRVIIIGGGPQVAQVAMGAVNEADRHNIRGQRISVDTIPLVGEMDIAHAVDAVARLQRASILVLAGSLMGGEISKAVERLKKSGIPVIALKMAGSVPKHADLVVTDPIQAGVYAVMHVSKAAVFDIRRVLGREF